MSDGAHQGYKPSDVLKVILGGETEDETKALDTETFCAWIRSADPATPLVYGEVSDVYDQAARIMAACFLRVLETNPPVAGRYTLKQMYSVAKRRFPRAAETFDGATAFMVGWAFNAARKCSELPPVQNPAIVTLEV